MITDEEILEIKISPKILDIATKRAKGFKSNKYTFSNNEASKIAGFIAEEVFNSNFPGVKVSDKNFDCDFIIEGLGGVDIKTKRCKSKPSIEYDCSLSAYQAVKQKSDYLIFCRCDYNMEYLWVLGIINKAEFLKKAQFIKTGESMGRFVCRADMYNIKIKELDNFMERIYG